MAVLLAANGGNVTERVKSIFYKRICTGNILEYCCNDKWQYGVSTIKIMIINELSSGSVSFVFNMRTRC